MSRVAGIYIVYSLIIHQACVPTKQLNENQYLLYTQKIIGNNYFTDSELQNFLQQKPNRKFFHLPILPYLYIYNIGEKVYQKHYSEDSITFLTKKRGYFQKSSILRHKLDSVKRNTFSSKDTLFLLKEIRNIAKKRNKDLSIIERKLKEGNWLMRVVGEKPTVHDFSLTQNTLKNMYHYMHQNGYFTAQVLARIDTTGKRVRLNYIIKENAPYTIRNLYTQIKDSSLCKEILPYMKSTSLLDSGETYAQKKIEKFRSDLTNRLKEKGYFDFDKKYISFEIDTNLYSSQLDITLIVKDPTLSTKHQKHYIDEIIFDTDAGIRKKEIKADSTYYNEKLYITKDRKYNIRFLDKLLTFKTNDLYSLSKVKSTQTILARLQHFKFININYQKKKHHRLRASIFSSHYNKYQFSVEAGLNVAQALLPGPFSNFSLRIHNLFGGFEILEWSARVAIESQANTELQDLTSRQYAGKIILTIPRILFPLSKKLKRKLYTLSPRTQLQIGLSYVDRPEYSRVNAEAGIGYTWQNRRNKEFTFKLWRINIVDTRRISRDFEERLQDLFSEGNNLIRSFSSSLISEISISYNSSNVKPTKRGDKSTFFLTRAEWGGEFANILNKFLEEEKGLLLGLRYYRFYKISIDYRVSFPISEYNQFAVRLAGGFIQSVGKNNFDLPYEKLFFSGGSYSNRGWQARRIGPGEYRPPVREDGFFDYRFEQPGEINIEYNMELRSKLIGKWYSALFMDISNVWTLGDKSRPGAQFLFSRFWKQFAISGGFGIRFDFSFLILRLDWAFKIYDPARPEGYRFIVNKLLENFPAGEKGQSLINIGIGYPF